MALAPMPMNRESGIRIAISKKMGELLYSPGYRIIRTPAILATHTRKINYIIFSGYGFASVIINSQLAIHYSQFACDLIFRINSEL